MDTKVRQYTRVIDDGVDETMDDKVDQLDRWLIGYKDGQTFIEVQGESLFVVAKTFLLTWNRFKRPTRKVRESWRKKW